MRAGPLLWTAAAACVVLRVAALRSDPYPGLDWSSGLLTDEGFYIHNARNQALFGHARLDEFNNMLLSPVLHGVQAAVFSVLGVGAAQARLVSVGASLLALVLLWDALRRAFDARVAWTGALLLGLDHGNLLFSRMALLDPPAALGAVAAFWCLIRGCGTAGARPRDGARGAPGSGLPSDTAGGLDARWLFLAGALAALTAVNRALAAYVLVALGAGLAAARAPGRSHAAFAAGAAAVIACWAVLWLAPNLDEMAAMTGYYRTAQLQPRSWSHLAWNIWHGIAGDSRGLGSYLFRHTPVLLALALAGLAARPWRAGDALSARVAGACLWAWLTLGAALLLAASYSPARYCVTLFPALAALAAMVLWRLPETLAALASPAPPMRTARAGLAALLAWHLAQAAVHRGGPLSPGASLAVLATLSGAAALAAGAARASGPPAGGARLVAGLLVLWAAINAGWLTDWIRGLDYEQYNTSRWLGRSLPAGAVLVGDVAPGLCMENRLRAVIVIPGLCNESAPGRPPEPGRPRFVAILDGQWKEPWWVRHHPRLVAPERRIALRRIVKWDVGVYAPPPEPRGGRALAHASGS